MTAARVGRQNPVRQLIKSSLAAALGPRRFLVGGPQDTRTCCLTFDDGPDPVHTPRLLDVLREHAVVATFFVVGEKAERHPALVRRIVQEGHALGHHSWTHGDPAVVTAQELAAEVERTRELLRGLVGQDARLFRPVKGKVDAGKLARLLRARQTVVLWNVDPGDYATSAPDDVGSWLRDRPFEPGDLVLLHDDRPHAALALPPALRRAGERGVRFGLVSGWAA